MGDVEVEVFSISNPKNTASIYTGSTSTLCQKPISVSEDPPSFNEGLCYAGVAADVEGDAM